MVEQVLDCTNCKRTLRFELDLETDGNHIIVCPECGHRHYRVVRDGRITDVRWNPNYNWVTITASSTGTGTGGYSSYLQTTTAGSDTSWFLYDAWNRSTWTGGR